MTNRFRRSAILWIAIGLLSQVGCAKLLGGLRRDFDDGSGAEAPTYGGRWSERGVLASDEADDLDRNDPYAPVGHSNRYPASERYRNDGRRGWIGEEDQSRMRRDRARFEEADGEGGEDVENVPPPQQRQYRNGARATRSDFMDDGINEGSLWASDGQTNYYFTKNKIRGVGDLVNVTVEEALLKDAFRELKRTLSPREKDMEIEAAQERLNRRAAGLEEPRPATAATSAKPPGAPTDTVATNQAGPQRAPASEGGKPPEATAADIDVSLSAELKAGDIVMAEIVERFQNGNYKIRGTKRVPYRGGARMMNFVAVARGTDIGEDDSVASGKLYEYRIDMAR